MQTNNQYHIDVTPEEDMLFKNEENVDQPQIKEVKKYTNATFVKMVCLVFGAHVAAVAAIGYTSFTANAANISDDKKYVGENTQTSNSTSSQQPAPTASPTPALASSTKPNDWPKTSSPVITKPKQKITKKTTEPVKYTTHYTVKQGDTLHSISRKFKLKVEKLVKINNIKDPAKLQVGQLLKFM